jgi:hypothetical protein
LLEAISRNRTVDSEMIQIVDGLFQKAAERETV